MQSLPYPVVDWSLLSCEITLQELKRRLGAYHREMDANDNEAGPCVYWAFHFPCGLITVVTFHLLKDIATVDSDRGEIDHILYHLPLSDCVTWRLDLASPDVFEKHFGIPHPSILWRQDEYGNKVKVGRYSSERVAACIKKHLELNTHKQTFWLD